MNKPIELNIQINSEELDKFKFLCERENLSVAKAISEYIKACIEARKILEHKSDRHVGALSQNGADVLTRMAENIHNSVREPIDKSPLDRGNGTINKQTTLPIILLVEDSLTVREKLAFALLQAGYRVDKVRDGQQAWSKLNAVGSHYDLILCGIEMPGMNGWELLTRLKQDARLAKIPVAMLTFMFDEKDRQKEREKAERLGASGYLSKSEKEEELLDIIAQLLKGQKTFPPGIAPAPPEQIQEKQLSKSSASQDIPADLQRRSTPPSRPSRRLVMIVDDSIFVRQMVKMSFEKFGYLVEQARDGQQAWDMLNAGLLCDLIVCDIEMPRMNGFEFLSLVQQHPKWSSIPVAMLTSRGSVKMKQIAAKHGARAYFVKPFVEQSIIDAAQKLINGEVLLQLHTLK